MRARNWPMRAARLAHLAVLLIVVALAALSLRCGDDRGGETFIAIPVSGGDADRGAEAMQRYACGTCHTIPGVDDAGGVVAPPLDRFGRRAFIGGHAPNTAQNLVRWLLNPQDISPGTDMPALGLTEEDARNIAAYLEGLD